MKHTARLKTRFGKYLMHPVAAGLAVLAVVFGCTKDTSVDWSVYYNYFPVEQGHWAIYQVDSVAYNKLLDTAIAYRYLVRETIRETFTDLENKEWQRIDHEVLRDSVSGWHMAASFAQKRGRGTAEKIEFGLRFIRMIFPFAKYTYWSGNSYIHYDDLYNCDFYGDWEYQYRDLFVDETVSGIDFDSVVVIQQVADSGLICKSLGIEMYAPRIGMIYRRIERLTTQDPGSDPFYLKAEDGYILIYRILDWKRD